MSKNKQQQQSPKAPLKPTESKVKVEQVSSRVSDQSNTLVFGRRNYQFILIGFGVMILGYLLMMGGSMPSPDVWDEGLIYSFRRTVLAPFTILAGIGILVYAIFTKSE
jgi:hypothetical protein